MHHFIFLNYHFSLNMRVWPPFDLLKQKCCCILICLYKQVKVFMALQMMKLKRPVSQMSYLLIYLTLMSTCFKLAYFIWDHKFKVVKEILRLVCVQVNCLACTSSTRRSIIRCWIGEWTPAVSRFFITLLSPKGLSLQGSRVWSWGWGRGADYCLGDDTNLDIVFNSHLSLTAEVGQNSSSRSYLCG